MKRFFLISALASFAAAILSLSLSAPYEIIFFISALVIITASFIRFVFHKQFYASLIVFAIIFSLFFLYAQTYSAEKQEAVEILQNNTCEISASVIEEREFKGDYFIYYIETSYINCKNAPQNIRLLLYTSTAVEAGPYDELKGEITFSPDFNSIHLSRKADGYFASATTYSINVHSTSVKPFYAKILDFKNYLKRIFAENLPNEIEGIPMAILTGDKDSISDSFYSNVKYTGMSHVLAVSGLHISIICTSVINLLLKLKTNKKIAYSIGFVIVILLAAVAGFSGSVMRSAIMYGVIVLSKIFVRKADAINSLGFAVTILLIATPFNIYSVSFCLSTLGTLGIVLLVPKCDEKLKEWIPKENKRNAIFRYFIDSFVVSLAASIFIIPYSLYVFGYITALGPIVNVILTSPVYLLLMFSAISVVFSWVPFLSTLLFKITGIFALIFKEVIDFFAEFEFAGFFSDDELLPIFALICVCALSILFIFKKRRFIILILSVVLVVSLVASLFFQNVINSKKTKIHIIDSTAGPSMVITRGFHSIIIGSGCSNRGANKINQLLDSLYIDEIDMLILPSNNENFVAGSEKIISKQNIKLIVAEGESNLFNIDASLNNFKATVWKDIDITAMKSYFGYNILIDIRGITFLLETYPKSEISADYILTAMPEESFDNSGEGASYFIFDDFEDAVKASSTLSKKGAKTAISLQIGTITATINSDNNIEFSR